jgi:hypothetical protein
LRKRGGRRERVCMRMLWEGESRRVRMGGMSRGKVVVRRRGA